MVKSFVNLFEPEKKKKQKTMPYYAVGIGRQIGVFTTWPECKNAIDGYSNPKFRKFDSREEAESFVTSFAPSSLLTASSEYSLTSTTTSSATATEAGGKQTRTKEPSSSASSSPYAQRKVINSKYDPPKAKTTKATSIVMADGSVLDLEDGDVVPEQPKQPWINNNGNARPVWNAISPPSGDERIIAYTDGAYSSTTKKAGAGIHFPNGEFDEQIIPLVNKTCAQAEIIAVLETIELTNDDPRPLHIITDSSYCYNTMTTWYKTWKDKGDRSKANLELWDRMFDLTEGRDIVVEHIRGHKGIAGNEAADKLAVEARNQ